MLFCTKGERILMKNDGIKKVTVYDVAKRAGVAPGTVSRVINNKGYMKDETRQQILNVIEEMQYIPNRAGRALKTTRTGLVLLAIPDTANTIYVGMITAVNKTVKQKGYSMVLYYTEGTLEGELKAVRMLRENLVDGLFLINFSYSDELRNSIDNCYAPIVLCGMCNGLWADNTNNNFDTISIDVYRGIYDSMTHLIKQGHKEIAYLAGVKNTNVYQQRFDAYCAALRDYGLKYHEEYVFWGDYTEENGYSAGKKIILMDNRPTAVCASNDLQAIGFWKACRDSGVAVPREIALCGMDNLKECEIVEMSSINMCESDVGKTGAEIILQRMNQTKKSPAQSIKFFPSLIIRKTSERNIEHT